MWKVYLFPYGRQSPPKIQEIEMKQKWFSDGLPNEISGFEMKMSKYKTLSVLLWRNLVKIAAHRWLS